MDDCSVCKKGLPAACTGVLIGPQLVLSASHCLDMTDGLGGKLTKVVFGTSLLDSDARSIPVERYVLASKYGIERGNDLMLIRLSEPAPPEWKVQRISTTENGEYPPISVFGFGDTVDDENTYSAGTLRKLQLQTISPVGEPTFLTMVFDKKTGTCNGDSGAAALVTGTGSRGGDTQSIVGVLSSNTVPCTGSNALFVSPSNFGNFIRRGCKDLGVPSPLL